MDFLVRVERNPSVCSFPAVDLENLLPQRSGSPARLTALHLTARSMLLKYLLPSA